MQGAQNHIPPVASSSTVALSQQQQSIRPNPVSASHKRKADLGPSATSNQADNESSGRSGKKKKHSHSLRTSSAQLSSPASIGYTSSPPDCLRGVWDAATATAQERAEVAARRKLDEEERCRQLARTAPAEEETREVVEDAGEDWRRIDKEKKQKEEEENRRKEDKKRRQMETAAMMQAQESSEAGPSTVRLELPTQNKFDRGQC